MSTRALLLVVAGAKGAVGSTTATAVAAWGHNPETVLPSLTISHFSAALPRKIHFAGWDLSSKKLPEAIRGHGVLPEEKWGLYEDYLERLPVRPAPCAPSFAARVEALTADIAMFRDLHPQASPVLINLLPACAPGDLNGCHSLEQLYEVPAGETFPDLAYIVSAILSGIPVVNFTPNAVEIPAVVGEAVKRGVPLCGRDGKTGQTYLKVVLASALKARSLFVDGWYSLNILGNEDGKNLTDPAKAAGKLANKTGVLDEILGYRVGNRYGSSCHRVAIDYYPPRGDAKEAWDVIDFLGLFGMPMSLRVNLLARDSILAAPLVLDLACWMAALQDAGRAGLVPELGFYFKKPLGVLPPVTFQEQMEKLKALERECTQGRC